MPVLGAEHLVDARIEPLGDDPRALDERGIELARGLLELGPHELGVGAGLLAVEHARADLDRIGHEPRDVVAALLALARQPHGARVVDDEAVDQRRPPCVRTWENGRGVAASMICMSHGMSAT